MVHQNALITGASSGLGAAFARILSDSTHLLLTGRDEERLRRVADGLAGRADIIVADLATDTGRAAVVESALAHGIDLLVCNAGLGWSGGFLEQPIARQREVISTNLVATIELLHALLPGMIARARHQERRAGIIIVSSMAAFMPAPGLACYGASKAFTLRLAQSLAAELAREPVDVLALCPTYTETEFFRRAGLPEPRRAMAAETVAREAMAALGRRGVHFCSLHGYPQALRRFAAFNPALAFWRWPRRLAALLQHPAPQPR